MSNITPYAEAFARAFDIVMAAHRAGYHAPYSNLSDDPEEFKGYLDGFNAGCRAVTLIQDRKRGRVVAS